MADNKVSYCTTPYSCEGFSSSSSGGVGLRFRTCAVSKDAKAASATSRGAMIWRGDGMGIEGRMEVEEEVVVEPSFATTSWSAGRDDEDEEEEIGEEERASEEKEKEPDDGNE